MKNILVHGLGQNETSWNKVEEELKSNSIKVEIPSLYSMLKDVTSDYATLYKKFSNYCNNFKVNSLILIGTPYKVSKFLFKVQGLIFKIMPRSTFEKIGCEKKDFISLVNSMSNLDIEINLDKVTCKTLILCGVKDSQNMESAKLLNKSINNSSFKTIDNSSHEVNVDNPKELANTIYDFWKDRGN